MDISKDNFINEFVLYLYHNGLIDNDWRIERSSILITLKEFCQKEKMPYDNYSSKKIELLLRNNGLLHWINQTYIVFKCNKIYEFENIKLKKLDDNQINGAEILPDDVENDLSSDHDEENDSKKEMLEYISSNISEKKENFISKRDFACHICQINHSSKENFQNHIQNTHKNNPFFLKSRILKQHFRIFYQYCDNPSYIKFTILNTGDTNVNIERVLLIKSTSNTIKTLYENKKPENSTYGSTSYSFVVKTNTFAKYIKEQIVIIYELWLTNYVFAEYYFMHFTHNSETSHQNKSIFIKPGPQQLFIKTIISKYPDDKLKRILSNDDINENELINYDPIIKEYSFNKILHRKNAAHIFNFLVQLEDIEIYNIYSKMKQNEIPVTNCGNRIFSIQLISSYIQNKDVLQPGNDIILKSTSYKILKHQSNRIHYDIYHCKIKEISDTHIYFLCPKELNTNKKYNIEFNSNILTFKDQYIAIETFKSDSELQKYLFPDLDFIPYFPVNIEFDLINETMKDNIEQKTAVMNIIQGFNRLPYIIDGFPGTGKTTTIVESILQIKLFHRKSRILITSKSNAACDEIGKSLLKFIENNHRVNHIKILRIYANIWEYQNEFLEKNLVQSSNLKDDKHYYPDVKTIYNYDIIICTLSVIGYYKYANNSLNFFTHCFIDECGTATEIETLVCIASIYHPNINIIISGDIKQLSPIIKSDNAIKFGLKISLMERLLNLNCYKTDLNTNYNYNKRIQTKLIRNFRNHPDILEVSNRLFYNNLLKAHAPKDKTDWALNWYYLPVKTTPIIFQCVNGRSKQDNDSTSFFNLKEIYAVMNYVKRIMYFKINGKTIKEEDIGIISPYRRQYELIREELNKRKWYKIATGAVETFQGQEKPIIIISTVRSIETDRHGYGFLGDEKRLNVMLTRAQALLIIVGNLDLLSTMWHWKKAIYYLNSKHVLINKSKDFICDDNSKDIPTTSKNAKSKKHGNRKLTKEQEDSDISSYVRKRLDEARNMDYVQNHNIISRNRNYDHFRNNIPTPLDDCPAGSDSDEEDRACCCVIC